MGDRMTDQVREFSAGEVESVAAGLSAMIFAGLAKLLTRQAATICQLLAVTGPKNSDRRSYRLRDFRSSGADLQSPVNRRIHGTVRGDEFH